MEDYWEVPVLVAFIVVTIVFIVYFTQILSMPAVGIYGGVTIVLAGVFVVSYHRAKENNNVPLLVGVLIGIDGFIGGIVFMTKFAFTNAGLAMFGLFGIIPLTAFAGYIIAKRGETIRAIIRTIRR